MAVSKCVKCENTTFEIVEKEPVGSEYKYLFVQCSRCGIVIGLTDYYNIGSLIHDLAEKLGVVLE